MESIKTPSVTQVSEEGTNGCQDIQLGRRYNCTMHTEDNNISTLGSSITFCGVDYRHVYQGPGAGSSPSRSGRSGYLFNNIMYT